MSKSLSPFKQALKNHDVSGYCYRCHRKTPSDQLNRNGVIRRKNGTVVFPTWICKSCCSKRFKVFGTYRNGSDSAANTKRWNERHPGQSRLITMIHYHDARGHEARVGELRKELEALRAVQNTVDRRKKH